MKHHKPNKPHHSPGERHKAVRQRGIDAGAHMPQRVEGGYSDHKGYQGSNTRRMGDHNHPLPVSGTSDTRRRHGSEGLGKGSPAPGDNTVHPKVHNHLGTAGRGGTGRIGKSDHHKGQPTKMSESPSHEWFEKLGAK